MSFVSIIICTYNRELYLPKCLNHLVNQTANINEFEIIIVNNNSSDETDNICNEFIQQNPKLNIKYSIEKKPGLSNARNRGIEIANGQLIAFIDDDGFAKSNYISILIDIVNNHLYEDYIAFGGKVEPIYNKDKKPLWLSKYIDGLVSRVDLGNKTIPFNKKYPAGCNMVFRKSFFEKYGGFNIDLHTRGDDKFVFDKLKKNGLNVLYIPELYVEHFIDDYRIQKSFIIKLSKIIGQSEQIRLKKNNFFIKSIKFLEYVFKLFASFLISINFIFKKENQKAQYLILVRWYVLIGYFITKKL